MVPCLIFVNGCLIIHFWAQQDAWGASQSILSIMGAVPMAMAAVVVIPLCNKFGKRNVCAAGMIFGGIGGVIALLGKIR